MYQTYYGTLQYCFYDDCLTINGDDIPYSMMSNIMHRGGNSPAFIFDYVGLHFELPYNLNDEPYVYPYLQKAYAISLTAAPAISPEQESCAKETEPQIILLESRDKKAKRHTIPRCSRCGKKAILVKLDSNGHCTKCAKEYQDECRIRERQERERQEKLAKAERAMARYNSIPCCNICYSPEPRKRQRGFPDVKYSNITPKGHFDDFVAIDTETTGLTPSRDRIVELCAIRFESCMPVERFTTFVNPERPIPAEASDVNGITDDMVADAPTISQVLPAFENFIGKSILVGHNLEFDLKFLFYSGSTILETKRKYIDTLKQARRFLKRYNSWDYDIDYDYDVYDYKLETLCKYYSIDQASAHAAGSDALSTGDLFLAMVAEKQGYR